MCPRIPKMSAILRSVVLSVLAACSARPGDIDLERWRGADREPGQWLALGRTHRGDRFSPLAEITTSNVSTLGFAWEYQARSHRGRVEHGQESTPIVVDGILYVSGPWGSAFAVNARTGAEVWATIPTSTGATTAGRAATS